jgi:alpha-ketoglutarate-dependent taurine dioxygenase
MNRAAVHVDQFLRLGFAEIEERELEWTQGVAIVMDNWKVLHGRGAMPNGEKQRILERIYVE